MLGKRCGNAAKRPSLSARPLAVNSGDHFSGKGLLIFNGNDLFCIFIRYSISLFSSSISYFFSFSPLSHSFLVHFDLEKQWQAKTLRTALFFIPTFSSPAVLLLKAASFSFSYKSEHSSLQRHYVEL
jgi:hypothetical protein